MWNPPIVLTSEEQKIAARTRKTRKFLCFCASIAMSCSTQICSKRWPTIARSLEATSQWKRDCWPSPHSCRLTVTSATGTPSS